MNDRSPVVALRAQDRLIPLERGFNLRDFGGYPTRSGDFVRAGLLYRSGTMAYLGEDDRQRMRDLGLAAIVDLRREDERRQEPTDWHVGTGTDYWASTHTASSGILRPERGEGNRSTGLSVDLMIDLYRKLLVDHATSYRALFHKLRDGTVPILLNCAAGKDRTGVGVALVLELLGVERDLIVEDYCLTNIHADFSRLMDFRGLSARFTDVPSMPMFAADPVYLAATFEELDARHGGVEGYVRDQLELDQADLAAIRARLLQSGDVNVQN